MTELGRKDGMRWKAARAVAKAFVDKYSSDEEEELSGKITSLRVEPLCNDNLETEVNAKQCHTICNALYK